jgi:hypothetical protein
VKTISLELTEVEAAVIHDGLVKVINFSKHFADRASAGPWARQAHAEKIKLAQQVIRKLAGYKS